MDTANSSEPRAPPLRAPLSITTLKEPASTSGVTGVDTKASGWKIKCMVKEFLPGSMEENSRDNIKMTKKMGSGRLRGQMEEGIKDCGRMVSSMGLGSIGDRI